MLPGRRAAASTTPGDALWSCVQAGFHVGSRRGQFLGYVDRQRDGRYLAVDARGADVGSYASLGEATRAVTDAATTAVTDAAAATPG